jgi:hypothetical protein
VHIDDDVLCYERQNKMNDAGELDVIDQEDQEGHFDATAFRVN